MSLEKGFFWSHKELQFVGYSIAGITTSLYCKTLSICFDVGQGLPFQIPARKTLITHAHLDHAAGIPYLISQKNMSSITDAAFYVPENLFGPLQEIIRLWEGVTGHSYQHKLYAALPGTLYELDKLYAMKPFATVHPVPSQGYLVYEKKKRLKPEYRESPRDAKARGEDPNEYYSEPLIAFTGDTQIEFIDKDPDIARAKVLFMEVTFWDEAKPVEHARRWGHIHFDEFLAILPRLQNEKIALIHSSMRYSAKYLEEILDKRLSPAERQRVCLFPRPN